MSTIFGIFEASPQDYLAMFTEACNNLGLSIQGANTAVGQNQNLGITYKITALGSTGYRYSAIEVTYMKTEINIENDTIANQTQETKKVIVPTAFIRKSFPRFIRSTLSNSIEPTE